MNIPVGLRHVLDVYRLVNQSKYSYTEAFKRVATKSRITEASVRSSCTRDIGINTEELEMFLDPNNAEHFKLHLSKRFPHYQDSVREFINGILGKNEDMADELTKVIGTLFDDEKKNLITGVLLKSILENIEKWILREDIPNDVRVQMQDLLKLGKDYR
jgi:hypothetical protein